jgi:peptide/nickel transport system permease protein
VRAVLLYILRRLISAISVVIVTVVASFMLFFLAPTDPAGVICGPKCTPERLEDISRSLNLDQPPVEQVALYFKGIVIDRTYSSGGTTRVCEAPCLGYSYVLGEPVTAVLSRAVPVTLSIVLGGGTIYLCCGVLFGTIAARLRGTIFDRMVVGTALTIGSIPYFVVAIIIVLYATFLPRPQYVPVFENPLKWATGMLAAWLCLGLYNTTQYTRYSRASMIEAMSQDFTRTARSKGISERRVIYRHGLRAAMTPVVTIFGVEVAYQLVNTIFTESIFGLPGLGMQLLRAFNQYDLPILMGGVIVGATLLVFMNLVVDILYTVLDPRVRLG